jgi:hypothetical protein
MNRSRKLIGIAGTAALAFFAVGTRAQQAPAGPPTPPGGDDVVFIATSGPGPMMPPDEVGFIEFEGSIEGKTVTGAPFTANFSTQRTQTLADGNVIQRSTTGTIARDSQGRTRRDMTLPPMGAWAAAEKIPSQISTINDPVAGMHYVLDPNQKIARQMPAPSVRGVWKYRDENGTRSPSEGGPDNPNVTTTSLGTQTINGISSTGTRTTRTIPAGAIGNQKPIVVTVERWYSADLQTAVLTKRSDPRSGDTVTQLTNIQRQEPAASLFQVPADYTIQAGKGGRGHHGHYGMPSAPPPPPAE